MSIVSEQTWYVQSSQRTEGESINNFTVDVSQKFVKCKAGQTVKFKLVSFNGLNSFYNVSKQNNTFTIIYNGTPYEVKLDYGFYTTFDDILANLVHSVDVPPMIDFNAVQNTDHTNRSTWSWKSSTDNDNVQIVFPYGRNSHALLGIPFNFGNPYTLTPQIVYSSGQYNYAWATPFPMMYNYLQNINLRANLPYIQNIEYDNTNGGLNFSTLLSKIPVNAAPYENIWFNVQDVEQYVSLCIGTGHTPVGPITFRLTDDYQQLLECDYDWEAVIKIEVFEDETPTTVQWQKNVIKNLEDILLINTDMEHIMMGEPREHDLIGGGSPTSIFRQILNETKNVEHILMGEPRDEDEEGAPKSILVKLEGDMSDINQTMKTAFLDGNNESRIWQLTDNIIGAFGAGDNKFGHGSVFKVGAASVFVSEKATGPETGFANELKNISSHLLVEIGPAIVAAGGAAGAGASAGGAAAAAGAEAAATTISTAIETGSGVIVGLKGTEAIASALQNLLKYLDGKSAESILEHEPGIVSSLNVLTKYIKGDDKNAGLLKLITEYNNYIKGDDKNAGLLKLITEYNNYIKGDDKTFGLIDSIVEISHSIDQKDIDLSKIDLSKLDLDLSKLEVDLSKLNGIELMNLRDISRHLEGIRLTMGEKEIDLAPLIDQLKHQDVYQNSMVDQLNKLNKTLDLTPIANQIKDGNDIWKGVGKVWENIGKNFVSLVKHITGKSAESKITYDTEISELNRIEAEIGTKDVSNEIHKWVGQHQGLKFDSNRSDKDSWNELISTAVGLETKTHDQVLERWVEEHKNK